jgi:hypothetical protein
VAGQVKLTVRDPKTPTTFWESGIYGWQDPWTMGVFVTKDNGQSFKGYLQLSIIQSHQDSVSVDFKDPERKTQLSGGHEQKQVLFRSTDSGANFVDIGKALPAGLGFCTGTHVIDSQDFLVGCAASWSGSPGAVVRSSDGGATFTKVSTQGVKERTLQLFFMLQAVSKSLDDSSRVAVKEALYVFGAVLDRLKSLERGTDRGREEQE